MKYTIEEQTLTDIAEAIREGYDDPFKMTPEMMPYDIRTIIDERNGYYSDLDSIKTSIENNGVEVGDNALTSEYADKINDVYDAGQTKEWSDFWDNYQNNGQPMAYTRAFFGSRWNDVTFKPKYDIRLPENTTSLIEPFYNCSFTNIKDYLDRHNLEIDFSNYVGTAAIVLFYGCSKLTVAPLVKLSPTTNFNTAFYNCRSMHTIEGLPLGDEGTQTFATSMFGNCTSLENITITSGKIGRSISFSACSKLTFESLKSIITHLKDYAGTDEEFTYTLTLHADAWARIEAEGATSPNGTSWRDYVGELGWNVA